MRFVDLQSQYSDYKAEIDAAVKNTFESGQFILGPAVKELESKLADYVGVRHCIGTASGTDSLILALLALGIGPGDEVITVPFTWVSSVEAIRVIGATPVFVDIDPSTFCMDVGQVRKAISERTRAIMPVSLFGQVSDHKALAAITAEHDIPVLEDAAQSFGATQEGIRSCALSQLAATSFFPTKPLGCYGDAGAIFTDDDELAERLYALRIHGQYERHNHQLIGRNARIDTLQAAILLAKFTHFESEVKRRQAIAKRYDDALEGICCPPAIATGNTHVYAQYTVRLPQRDRVSAAMSERGIPTAVYYPRCVHLQPAYQDLGYKEGSLPAAEAASKEVLSLPMHPWLTEQEQEQIIGALREVAQAPQTITENV